MTWSFFRDSLSCTTLMELAPMSTPTRFLPSPISKQSVAGGRGARQKLGGLDGRFLELRSTPGTHMQPHRSPFWPGRDRVCKSPQMRLSLFAAAAVSLTLTSTVSTPALAEIHHVVGKGHTLEAIAAR